MDDMKEGMESEVARLERTQDRLIGERDAARAGVERLKQECAAAKQRADEWEYRAGDWMVRAEDAEAQLAVALEELAKARKAAP